MRKVAVTGAAGFVGSHLVEAILRLQGIEELFAIDSYNSYYDPETKRHNQELAALDPRVNLIQADLVSADLSACIPPDVEVVFHQAGQPGVRGSWGTEFSEYTDRNILLTQRLLEYARGLGSLKRFVYASSSSVYGNADRYPCTENTIPRPLSPYGVTKLAAEHLCTLYAENYRLPTISLRYFTVYGPRQRPDMAFTQFCRKAIAGNPITVFGNGEQVRDFTFIGDVVRANIQAALSSTRPGTILNISGGTNVTINDAIRVIGDLLSVQPMVEYVNDMKGDVRRTGGLADRAEREIGWVPEVELEVGLSAQVDWARTTSTGLLG